MRESDPSKRTNSVEKVSSLPNNNDLPQQQDIFVANKPVKLNNSIQISSSTYSSNPELMNSLSELTTTRDKLRTILEYHQREFPFIPVTMSHIAEILTVSPGRIRQLYNKLINETDSLPSHKGNNALSLAQKGLIITLYDQALPIKNIVKELKLPRRQVSLFISSLIKEGLLEGRKKESHEKLKNSVRELRQQNFGNKAISEQLGDVSRAKVMNISQELINEEGLRLRKKRRTPEEIHAFEEKLLRLINPNIPIEQIAKELDVPYNYVISSLNKLRRTGRLEPKYKRRNRQEIESQDKKVIELKNKGIPFTQIASELEIPYFQVIDSIERIQPSGRKEKKAVYNKRYWEKKNKGY